MAHAFDGGLHPETPPSSSRAQTPALTNTPRVRAYSTRRDSLALGVAGGSLPDGTTIDDRASPGIANLDSDLVAALRQATETAAQSGHRLEVTSGWRSFAYQEQLRRTAIASYGSVDEAARWVADPSESSHVTGHAVDIGPSTSAAWLGQHGSTFGLCRTYANEEWHFELQPNAPANGCPPMYADAAHRPQDNVSP
jgi:LAS superfamily LD-carboxypeptidase LdcB